MVSKSAESGGRHHRDQRGIPPAPFGIFGNATKFGSRCSGTRKDLFFATRLRAKVETVLCTRADILASDKPETYAWILEDFGR